MNKILDEFNLWNKELDFGVDRLFSHPKIVELLNRREIQVFTGIRRCGKTTLMRQCMRHLIDLGVKKHDILFVPCDNPLLNLETIDQLHQLIEEFRKNRLQRVFILLDEIQSIPSWEKYLKGSYDSNVDIKFIISGSTASFFASDVASLLTGRHFYHQIETLYYNEFLRLNPNGTLIEYLEWGGFPEVIKARSMVEKEALLTSYLSTIIQRDIIERFKVRDKQKLTSILQSLILTVGGKINATRLSIQFGINHRTIERYINLGKDAFLLRELPFFSYSLRKNRHMLPKVYPADIGFTRILTKRFEHGRSAEWAVLHHLEEASYWSDGEHEVDFVTREHAIQVTMAEMAPQRETEALVAIKKAVTRKPILLGLSSTRGMTAIEEFLMKNPEKI